MGKGKVPGSRDSRRPGLVNKAGREAGREAGPTRGRMALMALSYAVAIGVPALALREAVTQPSGLPLAVTPRPPAGEAAALARQAFENGASGGPEGRAGLSKWLQHELEARGYAVFRQDVVLHGRGGATRRAQNIVGVYPGKSETVVMLVAPLEPGDPASARAIAAVLGAARRLAGTTTATVAALFEAGADRAHEGARVLARTYARTDRVVAAVGIGPIPDRPCDFYIGAVGQPGGYAPVWLRNTASRLALAEGFRPRLLSGVGEWGARTGSRSAGPHGPLLAAGVPAITYGCGGSGYAAADASPSAPVPPDRFERLALRFARTLDSADLPPAESQGAVTISDGAMISADRFNTAAWTAFLPLWAGTALAFANAAGRRGAIRRALGRFAVRLLPGGVALAGLLALPRWGEWPRQAPAPEMYASAPPLAPLAWVALAAIGAWLALRPARAFFARAAERHGLTTRRAYARSLVPAELLALSAAALLALAWNPFAAVTLLLPAAWAWPLAVGGPGSALLTLFGGTGAMVVAAGAGYVTGLGPLVIPFAAETAAAGGWSLPALVAALLVAGAGVGGLARSFR